MTQFSAQNAGGTAKIFDIFRGTTHDGPGLRTTVFFAGCLLACKWCHNPEGICFQPVIWYDERQCIGCFECLKACKHQALAVSETGIRVDRSKCTICKACLFSCPSNALELTVHSSSMDELVKEVLKDQAFYEKSGGGVTASGGECMLQAEFVKNFFIKLKIHGINTAVDSSGYAPFENFKAVLPWTDILLYDIKFIDEAKHLHYTGKSNSLILNNLEKITSLMRERTLNCRLIIRTPLIPSATATNETLLAIADYLESSRIADLVELWELCAFNNTCVNKYAKLGKDWSYKNVPLIRKEFAESLLNSLSCYSNLAKKTKLTGILY
ncbi:MAG: glycyl-radical enzyme activating protein [Christensenellales bacterium]|jgi:pyruvate formate lyase activating enzyme